MTQTQDRSLVAILHDEDLISVLDGQTLKQKAKVDGRSSGEGSRSGVDRVRTIYDLKHSESGGQRRATEAPSWPSQPLCCSSLRVHGALAGCRVVRMVERERCGVVSSAVIPLPAQ